MCRPGHRVSAWPGLPQAVGIFPPVLVQDARACFVSIFSGKQVGCGSPLRSKSALASTVSAQGFGVFWGGGGLFCLFRFLVCWSSYIGL